MFKVTAIVDVYKEEDEDSFQVVLKDGTRIESNTVILAVGTVGRLIVPRGVEQAPKLYQWPALHTLPSTACNILVIGGSRQCAAQIVANSLDCRCWMREADVLSNRFKAFLHDDDETDSDDEADIGE